MYPFIFPSTFSAGILFQETWRLVELVLHAVMNVGAVVGALKQKQDISQIVSEGLLSPSVLGRPESG